LEALVPEKLHLSEEMVQRIVRETQAERELSQPEIRILALMLRLTLSEYAHREQIYSEPTYLQLSKQINKLHKALRGLKLALPSPGQISLRNYLIHLGEAYAGTRGPHPNLPPESLDLGTEEGVSPIDHYRSDERLDEMISSISQVLEWMNNTPASLEKLSDWWNRIPHWHEGGLESMVERVLETPDDLPNAHRRRRLTEHLIGTQLPKVYEMTFETRFGVSRPPGPGVRFVLAVLRHAGICNDHNRPFSSETVIKYRQNYLRRARGAASSSASLLDHKSKKLAAPPMLDNKLKN
jgi:hypothetical protein